MKVQCVYYLNIRMYRTVPYPDVSRQLRRLKHALQGIEGGHGIAFRRANEAGLENAAESFGLSAVKVVARDTDIPTALDPYALYAVSQPKNMIRRGDRRYYHYDILFLNSQNQRETREIELENKTLTQNEIYALLLEDGFKQVLTEAGFLATTQFNPDSPYSEKLHQAVWNVAHIFDEIVNANMWGVMSAIHKYYNDIAYSLAYVKYEEWIPSIVNEKSYRIALAYYRFFASQSDPASEGQRCMSAIANSLPSFFSTVRDRILVEQERLFTALPEKLLGQLKAYRAEHPEVTLPDPEEEPALDADSSALERLRALSAQYIQAQQLRVVSADFSSRARRRIAEQLSRMRGRRNQEQTSNAGEMSAANEPPQDPLEQAKVLAYHIIDTMKEDDARALTAHQESELADYLATTITMSIVLAATAALLATAAFFVALLGLQVMLGIAAVTALLASVAFPFVTKYRMGYFHDGQRTERETSIDVVVRHTKGKIAEATSLKLPEESIPAMESTEQHVLLRIPKLCQFFKTETQVREPDENDVIAGNEPSSQRQRRASLF